MDDLRSELQKENAAQLAELVRTTRLAALRDASNAVGQAHYNDMTNRERCFGVKCLEKIKALISQTESSQ
jgi:hypothetical protein